MNSHRFACRKPKLSATRSTYRPGSIARPEISIFGKDCEIQVTLRGFLKQLCFSGICMYILVNWIINFM